MPVDPNELLNKLPFLLLQYNQNELAKKKLISENFRAYGANVFDEDMNVIPPVVKDSKSGKMVKNPEAPAGASVDVKGGRYISVAEKISEAKTMAALEQYVATQDLDRRLTQEEKAKNFVLKLEHYDPSYEFGGVSGEKGGFWGGWFNEEDALLNLQQKQVAMRQDVKDVEVLPKGDKIKQSVLSELIKLKSNLMGDKYASISADYAWDPKKFEAIRDNLVAQLSADIKRLQK